MPIPARITAMCAALTLTCGGVAATAITNLGSNAQAAPNGCSAPDSSVLRHEPRTAALPGGAQLRRWSSDGIRVSEVYAPTTAKAHLTVWSAGGVTSSQTPGAALARHRTGIAAANGDVFDSTEGGIPQGDEVLNGQVVKAEKTLLNVLLLSPTGQEAEGHLQLTGNVTASGHGSRSVTGLNWQNLTGSGINVYDGAWGHHVHPSGGVDVVVSGGKVTAVRHSGQAPRGKQDILTGTGSAANWLAKLRPGDAVGVHLGFFSPDTPFQVAEAINHDAPYLRDGARWPIDCSVRNEALTARTAVGWDRKGDAMLVTVTGRGSSYPNMEYYMRQLGAYNAVALDGGGSTSMVVRKRTSGKVTRVDGSGSQRPVPNFVAITG